MVAMVPSSGAGMREMRDSRSRALLQHCPRFCCGYRIRPYSERVTATLVTATPLAGHARPPAAQAASPLEPPHAGVPGASKETLPREDPPQETLPREVPPQEDVPPEEEDVIVALAGRSRSGRQLAE